MVLCIHRVCVGILVDQLVLILFPLVNKFVSKCWLFSHVASLVAHHLQPLVLGLLGLRLFSTEVIGVGALINFNEPHVLSFRNLGKPPVEVLNGQYFFGLLRSRNLPLLK